MSFPEAEESVSHGHADFRVRGKSFATYLVNHHGDGRVALWLNSPPGAQEMHVRGEPKHFFVPPYVGPRGWLGVNLDKGLSWKRIAMLAQEAYQKVAPSALVGRIGDTIQIKPPTQKLSAERDRPDEVAARSGHAEAPAQDRFRVAGDFRGRRRSDTPCGARARRAS